jgi:hypothetical protein
LLLLAEAEVVAMAMVIHMAVPVVVQADIELIQQE